MTGCGVEKAKKERFLRSGSEEEEKIARGWMRLAGLKSEGKAFFAKRKRKRGELWPKLSTRCLSQLADARLKFSIERPFSSSFVDRAFRRVRKLAVSH